MTRRSPFTQADVSRALKGVLRAGLPMRGVEIQQDGKIAVLFADPAAAEAARAGNEWDEVLR